MDTTTQTYLNHIGSKDGILQNEAYMALMSATEKHVDWAYDVWGDLIEGLTDKDNKVRSITSQILCNLARSDPDGRMMNDFDALLNVTRDERFVTARHCLQAIWKVGLAGEEQRQQLLAGLTQRYDDCIAEKNTTLIRFDIIQGLRNLYDQTQDENVHKLAQTLIERETDAKYQKKYAKVWKDLA